MDESPLHNPSNTGLPTPEVASSPGEEVSLAQWQESEHIRPVFPFGGVPGLIGISVAVIVVLIFLGAWQHDTNFYIFAVVVLIAAATLVIQMRRESPRLQITLTTRRLVVGNKQYALSDIAGFWPQHDDGTLAINVEMKKPGILPVTFLYENDDIGEARETMDEVMPELEARIPSSMDAVSRYFRF